MNAKEYLGDSVYVEHERWGNDGRLFLRLTTDNGMGPSNEIFLEPQVYCALLAYVLRHGPDENGKEQ